jgi:hypothetical protein
MSSGGIVLNGRGFLPEEGPHDDPGSQLRYIAPGSGTYKYVEFPDATENMIIMHFPTSDVIDMSKKYLSEEEIREAYKQDTMIRFKKNCKLAFTRMIEMNQKGEDFTSSWAISTIIRDRKDSLLTTSLQ